MRSSSIYSELLASILNVPTPAPGVNKPPTRGIDSKPLRCPEPLDISAQMRFISNPRVVIEVKIRCLGCGALSLRAPKRILVESRVQIGFNQRTLEAKISSCTAQPDGFWVEASFQEMAFVRKELRVPVDFAAELIVDNGAAAIPVRVVDMSPSGLGLAVPIEVAAGTGAVIHLGSRQVYGEIRYCFQSSGFYHVGVQLKDSVSK